jgi:prevent-host-death family protein
VNEDVGNGSDETVGAFEAKTHLSRLLADVERGKIITITRRGVPVAVLAPPESVRTPREGRRPGDDADDELRARQAIDAWIAYRDAQAGLRASVAEILEWVKEDRP